MHGEVGRFFGELCTREKPDEQFGLIRNHVYTVFQSIAAYSHLRAATRSKVT